MRRLLLILVMLVAAGAGWQFRDELGAWYRGLPGGAPAVTPIADIAATPQRFDGREVTVAGTVSGTSEIRFAGQPTTRTYTLRDGKAEIVVDTRGTLPPRGQALKVTGKASRSPGAGLAPRLTETKRETAR